MPEEKKMYTSKNPIIQKCFDIINSGDFYVKPLIKGISYELYRKSTDKKYCYVSATHTMSGSMEYVICINDMKFDNLKTYAGLDFSDLKILHDVLKVEWEKDEPGHVKQALDYLKSMEAENKR